MPALPILGAAPDAAPADAPAPSVALTGTVAVFDPAMCCPTGVCGPGVDPALLDIARTLHWLEQHGVQVTRAGLAQEPQAFVGEPRVAGLLQAFGDAALPATLVNGAVLVHGRYPTREELVAALQPAATAPRPTALPVSDACCTPGSGCC